MGDLTPDVPLISPSAPPPGSMDPVLLMCSSIDEHLTPYSNLSGRCLTYIGTEGFEAYVTKRVPGYCESIRPS